MEKSKLSDGVQISSRYYFGAVRLTVALFIVGTVRSGDRTILIMSSADRIVSK